MIAVQLTKQRSTSRVGVTFAMNGSQNVQKCLQGIRKLNIRLENQHVSKELRRGANKEKDLKNLTNPLNCDTRDYKLINLNSPHFMHEDDLTIPKPNMLCFHIHMAILSYVHFSYLKTQLLQRMHVHQIIWLIYQFIFNVVPS